jgi:hypothetical protein
LKVENLYADGAPELISAASVALVAKQGGTLTYSPAYTPEMNGLAERSNHTAYNGGDARLLESNLPASFWVYAVEYAVVVYNYLPTNTKSGRMQPFNSRFGKVGNVKRFKMWGCIAYIHIPAVV